MRGRLWLAALPFAVVLAAPAADAAISDGWITAKTKIALLTTTGVSAGDINVDTVDGRVTLHGTVSSAEEKARAEHEARKVHGVREVRNLLQVVPTGREEAVKAGRMVMTGGLLPSSQGVRIHARGGELTQTDGPFPETKELLGGFAIFELASREEAIEHGRRFMKVHQEVLPNWEGTLEIRQVVGPDDPCAQVPPRK